MSILDMLARAKDGNGGEVTSLSPRRRFSEVELKSLKDRLSDIAETGMEICVTFRPQLAALYNGDTLTDITLSTLTRILKKHDMNVILVGEYSDAGLYHMHGVIKADGRCINSLKRTLGRELGRIRLRAISFTGSYVEYILKDTDKSRKIYNTEVIQIETHRSHKVPNQVGASPRPAGRDDPKSP